MNPFDVSVLMFFNQFAHRFWSVDAIVFFIAEHDLFKGGVFMALVWWLWFQRDQEASNQDRTRSSILSTLMMCIVAVCVARLFAHLLPFSQRPLYMPELHFQTAYTIPTNYYLETWSSFPSDHAAMFFTLATGLYCVARPVGIVAYVYAFVVAGFARVYLGFHWPSDIIVGAALGIAMGWVGMWPRVRHWLSRPGLKWLQAHPGSFYAALFLLTYQTAVLFGDLRAAAAWVRMALTTLREVQ